MKYAGVKRASANELARQQQTFLVLEQMLDFIQFRESIPTSYCIATFRYRP